MQIPVGYVRAAAIGAAVIFGLAVVIAGARVPGYSQASQPVAVLGARGMPSAGIFNAAAYVLPGLLAAVVMFKLRDVADGLSRPRRLGAAVLSLASLAFALQGLLPVRMDTLDSASSAPHAVAWTFWWLAYGAGAVGFAIGAGSGANAIKARVLLGFAMVTVLFAVVMPGIVMAGASQRIAFLAWFGGVIVAASAVAQFHHQDHR